MIWGMIHSEGGCGVVMCPDTVDRLEYVKILRKGVVPWLRRYGHLGYVFQQDSAPAHTSQLALDYLDEHGIDYLDWPSSSPDLSPIENICHILKQRLGQKRCPKSCEQVLEWVTEVWDEICEKHCPNLYDSMERRLDSCIKNKGGHTNY